MKDRSRTELIAFAAAAFGIWLSAWGILLRSLALSSVAFLIILSALIVFALCDND